MGNKLRWKWFKPEESYNKLKQDIKQLKEANKALTSDLYNSELNLQIMTDLNAQFKEALRIAHLVVCEKCSNRDVPKPCHRCWVTEDKDGNLIQFKKDNVDIKKLEGCPNNYGLDEEELCEYSNDEDVCYRCWQNALEDKSKIKEGL